MDLIDKIKGKIPWSSKRSGKWPTLRKNFLSLNPQCALCGGTKNLQAHHINPFHLHPDLELDPTNLIVLCEGNHAINCHLEFGHLGNFKSFNTTVIADATAWFKKITTRP